MNLVELLELRGIEYKKTNNPSEILVKCTSGIHSDSSPSLSLNIEKNIFNCWSCGFRGGLPKFLNSIGESEYLEFDSKQPIKIKKLAEKIQKKLEVAEVKLPQDRKIYQGTFRGIRPDIYREFGAFTTNEMTLTDYLCIPVYQNNKLKFIEGRLLSDLPNQSKYSRKPAKTAVVDILFPIDKISRTNHIILVEGLFDMINMWQIGFTNTLCIFGANNFSKKKVEILENKGITRVDLMFDSDKPGKLAAEKAASLLESRDIYVRIIELPPGIDPGELTKQQAEKCLR